MGSHSVVCHPTQVNAPRHNPSQPGWYSIYLPRTDGRLSRPKSLIADRPGIEPTTAWSQVRCPNHYATESPSSSSSSSRSSSSSNNSIHTLCWHQRRVQSTTGPCSDVLSRWHKTVESNLSYLVLLCWHHATPQHKKKTDRTELICPAHIYTQLPVLHTFSTFTFSVSVLHVPTYTAVPVLTAMQRLWSYDHMVL